VIDAQGLAMPGLAMALGGAGLLFLAALVVAGRTGDAFDIQR
jgi:hypothetical protein